MRILYNFFIQLFQLGSFISASLGNEKTKLWRDGRKGLLDRIEREIDQTKEVVWFHCASVGEFEQARPLLEMIKKEYDYFILLSFFSPSGYESKKNYAHADFVCYLPLDSSSNAKRFVSIVQPKLSFFAKYEFWFNLLHELHKANCPHFLISGIFRKKQQFFRFYGSWFRKHLAHFTHLYLQDERSAELLRSFKIDQCTVSGDGRFDRVAEIAKMEFKDQRIEGFVGTKQAVVFGSSWEKENELAFQMAQKYPQLKIIVAPHEFHKEQIIALSKKYKLGVNYYSETETISGNILVIDQMGLLSKIYRFASFAVIGGGFGKGIHNILEAAVYGCPVFFGPNYTFFKEAWDLLEAKGAKVFKNEKQFHLLIEEVVSNESLRKEMALHCKEYFNANTGSTRLIFNHLKSIKQL